MKRKIAGAYLLAVLSAFNNSLAAKAQENAELNTKGSNAAAESKSDPFGFGTIKQSMSEMQKNGSVSAETMKSLHEIEERGKRAQATMNRESVGRDEIFAAKRLCIAKNYAAADPLYRKSLELRQHAFGAKDWLCAEPTSGLAQTYAKRGWKPQAAQLYLQAVSLDEEAVRSTSASSTDILVSSQNNLKQAMLIGDLTSLERIYADTGKLSDAESICKKCIEYVNKYPSLSAFKVSSYLTYSQLLRDMHRDGEAMKMEAAARH